METKKLTAKDLMVGDYVYRPDCYDKVVEVRKDTILGSDPLRGLIPITELQPIPLTAEVLEKIGFKREEEARGFSEPYCVYVNDDFQYVIKVYPKGIMDRYSRFEIGDYDDNEYMSLLINSLHELQHALRLCCIDKEITL